MSTTINEIVHSRNGHGREIGPIGTASRIVAGLVAITLPVAVEGIRWWDLAALVAAPYVATAAARLITVTFERGAPGALDRHYGICSPAGCALIAVLYAAASGFGAATPAHGDVVFWGFVGASMLLSALRGDAGCELLAFPNAITGRRDRIGCILFTPIDVAEARHRDSGRGPAQRHRSSPLS
jgi:hypothetical protein